MRYVCIHGHFYQPPRENPSLEYVELQDSAYPYHDWNERITAECYAPNAASRILDADGRIARIREGGNSHREACCQSRPGQGGVRSLEFLLPFASNGLVNNVCANCNAFLNALFLCFGRDYSLR